MKILDKLTAQFAKTSTASIGKAIEDLVSDAITRRRGHERRWYDNNFFDDGNHFRVISRKTGRVIDHAYQNSGYIERAIPRASRQIRGVANLLFGAEPYPVIYPERLTVEDFMSSTGFDETRYQAAIKDNKSIARKQGIWVVNEWEELGLPLKLIDMILLAAKNSVSWIQIYSDTEKQELKADVYDAFDIIVHGERRDYCELPFITKTCPMDIREVKDDPRFDPKMVETLTPDNRYATSEIKDAYMRVRFGTKIGDEKSGNSTIIIKESFLKEVLTDDNWKDAAKKASDNGSMDGKSPGDGIMRHVFSAGGVTLGDEYVDYDEYPLVPFRFEPGPIYQVPFIERFIPQNKSVDVIVSRLEKWVNSMIVGVYQKRKGENFQVSNFPGGQVVDYETTPLTQMQVGTVGSTPFEVLNLLNKYIDEQGATTSALAQIPAGVRANAAIESLKSTEYANLKISTMMLKDTIKKITELILERTDKDYLEPHETSSMQDGEPQYFDVIGQRGMDLSKKINKPLPQGIIPIKKDLKVRIKIEPGLGLTTEGKKDAMESILNLIATFMKLNPDIVPMEAFVQMFKKFLESFGYGSTQELMEAMETGMKEQGISEDNMKKMQIAMLTALKDSGAVGPEADKKLVMSTQVGVAQALKDTGVIDQLNKATTPVPDNPELAPIPYKDAPEDIKRQMERNAGLTPSRMVSPSGSDQLVKHVEAVKSAQTPIVDVNAQKQAELAVKEKALNKPAPMSSFPINKFRKTKGGQNAKP